MYKNMMNLINNLEGVKRAALQILESDTKVDDIFIKIVEHLEEDIDTKIGEIEYFTLETKEGKLDYDEDSERFSLFERNLTCGSSLEAYNQIDEKWEVGRVESSHKYKTELNPSGYYFYNKFGDHISLEKNMEVRKRVTQ